MQHHSSIKYEPTWNELENRTRTFQLENEPELIHIIKTGFENTYFVVFEDGYGICNDMKVKSYTKNQIKEIFNIEL